MSHIPLTKPVKQADLFGSTKPALRWQDMKARWTILSGPHEGQRCILVSSFDKGPQRFGIVVLEDTQEEVVLDVRDFRLIMDTVVPPAEEPSTPSYVPARFRKVVRREPAGASAAA